MVALYGADRIRGNIADEVSPSPRALRQGVCGSAAKVAPKVLPARNCICCRFRFVGPLLFCAINLPEPVDAHHAGVLRSGWLGLHAYKNKSENDGFSPLNRKRLLLASYMRTLTPQRSIDSMSASINAMRRNGLNFSGDDPIRGGKEHVECQKNEGTHPVPLPQAGGEGFFWGALPRVAAAAQPDPGLNSSTPLGSSASRAARGNGHRSAMTLPEIVAN